MKTKAIHQHDDWFLIKIPGYGNIKDKLEVEIEIADDERVLNEYKQLRDDLIIERYQEKQNREIISEPGKSIITRFDQKFNTHKISSTDDILNNL